MSREELIAEGRLLPVMEHFYTIQGEGFHQGRAAYFIRLGGCDVGCSWCDVKDSWDASQHPLLWVEDIAKHARQSGAPIAVITGGEPGMYPLGPLSDTLHAAGLRVHLETSGAYPLSGDFDWVCVSPKKFKKPLDESLALADEIKVVVFHHNDFRWAESHYGKGKDGCQYILQPEWSKEPELLPEIIGYVKSEPRWRISLQVHKYMNVP